jgi:nitrate/TMAO reductase-like tetraheme cytochrome c subunit
MPKKTKKQILRLVLIGLGVFLVVFVASVELTSTSKFCSICHYMKPFYNSWKSSSHGEVECKVCHYPPGIRNTLRAKMEGLVMVGRYWTKLYLKSKPWAEIQDESCLQKGCHDRRLLEGPVQFKTVAFDHKAHFADLKRGKQLRCTSCHSQIVQGEHITVTETSCFLCHFKETENTPEVRDCNNCHKQDFLTSDKSRYDHRAVYAQGFGCDKCHSQIIIGDGAVPRENCFKCHFEQERLDKYDDTTLVHTMHIAKNKIECEQCHLEIQHKIVKDIQAIADCQACHANLHQAQKILYTGQGGKGVDHPMPNVMLEKGLSCKGCHMFHEESGGRLVRSSTSISSQEACESCHGKGFARILQDWEASTAKKLAAVDVIFKRAAAEVQAAKEPARAQASKALDEAAFNIDVVEKGKSVHNITYAQELLRASIDSIERALKIAGSSYKPDRTELSAPKAGNTCLTCHAGIEEINRPVYGVIFPHKNHVAIQNLSCATCHSNAKKHGELVATKAKCASCHHEDPTKDCGGCHTIQKSLYEGGPFQGLTAPKDIMAEAETECAACHVGADKKVVRPTAAACVECHDKDYEEIFVDWQTSAKKAMAELGAALAALDRKGLSGERRAQAAAYDRLLTAFEQDGSLGIHNNAFVTETLDKALAAVKSWGKG